VSLPPLAIAIVWIAVILGMTAAFAVFAHKWRERRMRDDATTASELLTDFLELRSRGELSAEEYQRIKERLNAEVERELAEEGESPSGADPTRALKATARSLLAEHNAEQKGSARAGERETNGAAGGAAQDGCDAKPPNGGDSTEERR
jgi:hypothetical protein